MNDRAPFNNPIRAALDECLSGAGALPSVRENVLRNIKGEKKVKKKLSVGLVFAIVLILAAVSALAAALLSAREIVDQKVLPIATGNDAQGVQEEFTHEELARIVDIARENGMEIPKVLLERLEDGAGFWEEETIMALAKQEFGPYPAGWTLEQQYWFEETMLAIGFKEINYARLPGENDLSYDNAVALAAEKIKPTGDDVTDETRWTRLITYHVYVDPETNQELPPEYYVEFMAKDGGKDHSYTMKINNQGEILDFDAVEPSWRDSWYYTVTAEDFYTVEGMARFITEWKPKVAEIRAAGEECGSVLDYLVTLPIGEPKASDISRDEAYQIARAEIMKDSKWNETYLSYFGTREVYLIGEDNEGMYHFCFTAWTNGISSVKREKGEALTWAGTLPFQTVVRVDAADGHVISLTENNDRMSDMRNLLGI